MADIFEEVDEEVRKDRFSELWQKYGRYIVAGVTAALAVSVAVVLWQDYSAKQRIASSMQFEQALQLIDGDKNDEATKVLAALTETGTGGYAMLARFRAAGVKVSAGDANAAVEIYNALADDDSLAPMYRDLARLYAIMQRIDGGDAASLATELEPLLAEDNPWRFSARELAVALALRQNDTESAKKHLKTLADDSKTPASMRRRASEMLRAVDG